MTILSDQNSHPRLFAKRSTNALGCGDNRAPNFRVELLRVLERASYVAITLGNLRKADIASNGIFVGECRRVQRMAVGAPHARIALVKSAQLPTSES